MSTSPSIITQIVTGAESAWTNIAGFIETAVSRVEAVFPQAAPAVEAIKQDASDVLGYIADGGLIPEEKALVTGVETLFDAVITAKTGGLALPLVGATNDVVDGTAALLGKIQTALALKAKSLLAENNAAMGGGTAVQTPQAQAPVS